MDLIPRATIEEIVGYRDRALELYAEAWVALSIGAEAVRQANQMAMRAHPGINGYNYDQARELEAFRKAIDLPDRDSYLRTAKKLVDCNTWAWIIERTELETLMDKEAKDTLAAQMRYVPDRTDRKGQIINQDEIDRGLPEVTVENVYATLQDFANSAEMIFRRGIANAFSKLDRRFKSHDGFKIGSRIILPYAFDSSGWNYRGGERDTMLDVERTFLMLDGKRQRTVYGGIVGLVDQSTGYGKSRPVTIENDYFRVRIYKNNNAHMWFMRKDLVEKVNAILADWYGEVIADGQADGGDPFANRKITPAKRFGFFPSPPDVVARVLDKAPLWRKFDDPPLRVLEPSAGTGAIAYELAKKREGVWRRDEEPWTHKPLVDCVELQPSMAWDLNNSGVFNRVWCQDFLTLSPKETGLYDVIAMNPPFDLERDIDHVTHAMKFLQPNGYLVAVMSAGTEFRETRKARAFRDLVDKLHGRFTDLPPGSFSSVGTWVNTVIVRLWANGREVY
jgi:hypothetical protein